METSQGNPLDYYDKPTKMGFLINERQEGKTGPIQGQESIRIRLRRINLVEVLCIHV
jgi:hypothetical protein